MVTDWKIKIFNKAYDVTPACEWGVVTEETLGQPGTARFTLQDRYMGWGDLAAYEPSLMGFDLEDMDVCIEITGQAIPVFRGSVQKMTADLPVAFQWRFLKINATDYQREIFGRRLIGTPAGDTWSGPDADGIYIPIDGRVYLSGTDKAIIATLLATASVPVSVIEADTYVYKYIEDVGPLVGDPNIPQPPDRMTIGGVMELLAGLASGNVQYWIDPAFYAHYVSLPRWWEQLTDNSSLARGMPQSLYPVEAAPVDIDNDNPNGVTSIGSRNLGYEIDYSNTVRQFYVNGSLGYEYNGGAVRKNGTGWVSFGDANALPSISQAQAFLDAPESISTATKLAAARRAAKSVERGILRGHCTVGNERHHVDGWHVGQLVKITDARLPGYLNGRYYVIQKVSTRLLPTINWRVYDLEWGDAPMIRSSSRRGNKKGQMALPGRLWDIEGRDMFPLPGTTVTVVGQLKNDQGEPIRVAGVLLDLKLEVWDEAGVVVLVPDGSISPTSTVSDIMGRWYTELTVGSQPGYRYRVSSVEVAP